ncbi:AAA family ATPase [Natrarchaeobius halalkaliphilus]|uniref:AAA family ATPase n=1 Tax=Natrarchaeobius halalkaliphilus TaxID=1679091 RepID=A0A3N6MFY0_9EURY|nr:AAA family ATPase [Natrarchaeobius halalkaliphilus]RQG92826.1 AAA family ATPase [Natrarchaeobius halalkaliphilus]
MSSSEQRTKLTLFSSTSTGKLKKTTQVLHCIREYGPDLSEVKERYQRESGTNTKLAGTWIEQLQELGVVSTDYSVERIRLTDQGVDILEWRNSPSKEPVPLSMVRAFAETYVGFYDTIALLSVIPARVSQVKELLNTLYDLNLESNTQAKQRVGWLLSMDLAKRNSGHEYSLTERGHDVYEDFQTEIGPPEASSLLVPGEAGQSSTTGEVVDSGPTTNADPKSGTRNSTPDETIDLPFLEDRPRKVVSIHVAKSDGTDERYERTVGTDVTIDAAEPLPHKEYQNKAVRYWSCDPKREEQVGDLGRGDVVLFHHHDEGYLSSATVLDTFRGKMQDTEHELHVLFEEVCEAAVERDDLFEVYGWRSHPTSHWARIDQKDNAAILDQYESIDEFISDTKGTVQFNYWSYQNWSIKQDFARQLSRQLQRKGQVILYGPPGTGKTFVGEAFAKWWTGKQTETNPTTYQTESVTFHPAFSYEDFIEGYSVIGGDNEEPTNGTDEARSDTSVKSPYGLKRGVFKQFCRTASRALDATPDGRLPPRYVLVIDELNRGNVPQIFGEIITLLEKDKRGSNRQLSQSGQEFEVPENVYIIATMNTADQSISKLDAALRRRFAAMSLAPEYDTLYDSIEEFPDNKQDAAELVGSSRNDAEAMIAASVLALEIINKKITAVRGLGKGKRIGHAYLHPDVWMTSNGDTSTDTELADVWRYDILPLLEEYFFDDLEQLEQRVFEGDAEFVKEGTNDVLKLTPSDLKENLRMFVMDNQHEIDIEFETE